MYKFNHKMTNFWMNQPLNPKYKNIVIIIIIIIIINIIVKVLTKRIKKYKIIIINHL